jgi:hypothetical protein
MSTVKREVRVSDPSLSAEANRLLTEELRRAVGADVAEVEVDAPRVERDPHGRRSGLLVGLAANRLAVAMTLLVALVVGAVVSLATGSWWLLALALGAHALGTLVILGVVLQMTTEFEHLSPDVAARLEDEGVPDPDALFSALVAEFGSGEHATALTPSHRSRPIGS